MRRLSLVFEVDDAATITDPELYDLADRIVTDIDPDPPVLTFHEVVVETIREH